MRLSVCLPVYNTRPEYLRRAVESVLGDRGVDLELIIRDDRSRVDYAALRDEISTDPRVRWIVNDVNLGMVGNWNAAVGAASGDLALVLGHDDWLEPGALSTLAREFADPGVVMAACGLEFVDANGAVLRHKVSVTHRRNIFVDRERYDMDGRRVAYLCLRNGNAIGEPSAVMFRREVFLAVNGYDSRFRHAADVDLNIRIAERGRTVYLRAPLLRRRRHDDMLTGAHLRSGALTRERALLFEHHRERHDFTSAELAAFRANIVCHALFDVWRGAKAGNWRVAAIALGQIGRYAWVSPRAYGRYAHQVAVGVNEDRC